MATQHEILCINKSDRQNLHERITHIGGKNSNGERWQITQIEAINGIQRGEWLFYVNKEGNKVNIIV